MAYLSQSDVEAKLGPMTEAQATYFTDTLAPFIEQYINNTTGMVFNNSTSTSVYVDGTCTRTLIIPTMSEVTSLYSVSDDGTETLIPNDSYRVYPSTGPILALRNKGGDWEEGFENYKIVGKAGFIDVPANIKAIALEMAVGDINANLNQYKSEKVGDWSVTYADSDAGVSISPISTTILQNYRRLSRSV